MGKNRWNVVLQLCVCFWFPVCRTDCPYAECECTGRIVICIDRNLQALPKLVKTNASIHWSLEVYGTNISRIPAGGLPPNLTDIDVDDNPITTIDDPAFDDSTSTLTWIYFSNVHFTRFPDAFGHLKSLATLSITDCNITDWNDDVWRNIGTSLNSLDLNNAGIIGWPSWIKHCTNLSEITIIWGAISSIPDEALDSTAHSLTKLTLNSNQLTIVPRAFSKLNSLQSLHLEDNHITDVRWLPYNNILNTLTLSNNYIWNASQLSEALHPYNASLYDFSIDNNHLTSIPNISYLLNIKVLDFTHNKISDSTSGALPSGVFVLDLYYNSFPYIPKIMSQLLMLTNIAMSNNAVRAIRETDFHLNTTTIDLGYNLLTELTDTSFPEHFRLQELDLNNNPLYTISTVALQHLPSLTFLNLRYTKITRLPLGLKLLRSLVNLDVTNSTLLVCTCMESSLATWITDMNYVDVQGNCGQTSVYEFFSVLSPLCPASAETPS